MNIDTRPVATDISLCTQEFCSIKYNKNGKIEKCKLRMEE